MKINHLSKRYALPHPGRRNLMPNQVCLSRFRMLYVVFFVLMILGPGDIVADCINPIALWKLEESGTAAGFQDEMNPGQHVGVCRVTDGVSACPEAESARYGMGQRFYAASLLSGIDIPSSEIFNWDGTYTFSISFWMKRDNSPLEDNEVIIGRDSAETGNDLHWWIGLHDSGAAMANFVDRNDTPTANDSIRSDKLLADNNWHYIVFVRNGVTNENSLYVDGHLEDKAFIPYSGANAFSAASTPINIGWLKLDVKYQYKGIVDEIALYDVALPQWFIHDRYHADERYSSSVLDPCD
jgi:hypothetical protein